jgi:hypothetical protein
VSFWGMVDLIVMTVFLLAVAIANIVLALRRNRQYLRFSLYFFGLALIFWSDTVRQVVPVKEGLGNGILLLVFFAGLFIIGLLTVGWCISLYRSRRH